MKSIKATLFLSMILLLSSCVMTTNFYQVYEVKPDSNIQLETNLLIYEDQNCEVTYNLWQQNGNIGFIFYNKTDKDIYLQLDKSFFIINGLAYQYFQNRTYTSSTSIGSSTLSSHSGAKEVTGFNYSNFLQTNKSETTKSISTGASSGYSVSYSEQKTITIPSKASKIISEFSINDELYRDCDLFKYPTKKQIKSVSFTETSSPIIFSNRISYLLENTFDIISFENSFYVEGITNYPLSEMFDYQHEEYCGQKSTIQTKYFKEYSPDRFYIKYTKGNDIWKH